MSKPTLPATPATQYPAGGAAFDHSPYAAFDDSILADGTALYTQLAVAKIAELSGT